MGKYPLLAPIAQRIFTIPTSSAASERSWSIFKFFHSARRNRLANVTVIKLAFIYSNQGSKVATETTIFDAVVDLVSVHDSAAVSTRELPPAVPDITVDAELMGQVRQLEEMMDDEEQHHVGDWDFDGAHWGDEEHVFEDINEQQTKYTF